MRREEDLGSRRLRHDASTQNAGLRRMKKGLRLIDEQDLVLPRDERKHQSHEAAHAVPLLMEEPEALQVSDVFGCWDDRRIARRRADIQVELRAHQARQMERLSEG